MQKTVSYSIDETVLKEFKKLTNENSINASKFVENLMKKYIVEHTFKNNQPEDELSKTL